MLLRARIECDLGNHEAELHQARLLVARRPRSQTTLRILLRAAGCTGNRSLVLFDQGDEITVLSFNLAALLPRNRSSYRYAGSLTTPTCGQGVQWNVLLNSITMTGEQIAKLQRIFLGNEEFPNGNRRPIQPLNGRTVWRVLQ